MVILLSICASLLALFLLRVYRMVPAPTQISAVASRRTIRMVILRLKECEGRFSSERRRILWVHIIFRAEKSRNRYDSDTRYE